MSRQPIQLFGLFAGLVLLAAAAVGIRGQSTNAAAPELYILSIGINNPHPSGKPRFADKDAQDFSSALGRVALNRFSKIHSTMLLNEQATQSGIAAAMKRIIRTARAEDTFVFYFSGRGRSLVEKRGQGTQFYLLPSGFDAAKGDLKTSAISAARLQYWFIQVECEHQFAAFDSSRSTAGFEDFKKSIDLENKRLAGLVRRDIFVLAIKGWSFELPSMHNGLFTSVLISGLNGDAALPTGDVDTRSLIAYVYARLPIVMKKTANAKARAILRLYPGSGRPFVYASGEDFTLGATSTAGSTESHISGPSPVDEELGGENAFDPLRVNSQQDTYKQDAKCVYKTNPSTSTGDRKGKDFALLIAGDNYDNWDRLVNPIFDAETLAAVLHERFDFETEILENPDLDCFIDAAKRYKAKDYQPDSQLLIFYAGHGTYLDGIDTGFLIPRNAKKFENDDVLGTSFINQVSIHRMLSGFSCKHVLMIVDACQSGANRDDKSNSGNAAACEGADLYKGNTPRDVIGRLLSCETRMDVTSAYKEFVSDGERGKHSPFADQLLKDLGKETGDYPFISMNQIYSNMQLSLTTLPTQHHWGDDRGRGDFLFFLH
jgi:uncharacterized caspase-like protein